MYLALYGMDRMYQDGSSFTWHRPCNSQTVCTKCVCERGFWLRVYSIINSVVVFINAYILYWAPPSHSVLSSVGVLSSLGSSEMGARNTFCYGRLILMLCLVAAGELFTAAAEAAMAAMKGRLANKYFMLAEEAWAQVEDEWVSNPVGGIGMPVSWDGDRKHQSGQSSRLHCFVGFLDSSSDHPLMIQQNVFLCRLSGRWL